MLIVTRHIGESIVINNNIKITLLHRLGDRIKVGITAPDDVTIHREEVYKIIHKKKNEKNQNEKTKKQKSIRSLYSNDT